MRLVKYIKYLSHCIVFLGSGVSAESYICTSEIKDDGKPFMLVRQGAGFWQEGEVQGRGWYWNVVAEDKDYLVLDNTRIVARAGPVVDLMAMNRQTGAISATMGMAFGDHRAINNWTDGYCTEKFWGL